MSVSPIDLDPSRGSDRSVGAKAPTLILDPYKEYMEKASNNFCIPGYKGRYHTFSFVYEKLKDSTPIIVELGTSRSFVDGAYEGCLSTDVKYWEPDNPEKWDWGAGIFTLIMAKSLPNATFHTVDCSSDSLQICKCMTNDLKNISYHLTTSEDFLKKFSSGIDLIYLDTGNIDEETAKLQLAEVKIIVERNLIKNGGYILIDDVRNKMDPSGGKAKYSIHYLLNNGFKIIMDEYQVLLRKI